MIIVNVFVGTIVSQLLAILQDNRGGGKQAAVITRVRRKRQRLGPNGSIESDPAVTVGLEACVRAGSLPIVRMERPRPIRSSVV
jgi:hypothetical protein